MAASAQVKSRMQLNPLTCCWFVMVVVLTWLVWTWIGTSSGLDFKDLDITTSMNTLPSTHISCFFVTVLA
jgi:hypothetical protein